jgi:PTH2 family peptidyl-tRNA hydrolase
MAELKQVILVRTDIKMSKGKAAAQVAHASVEAVLNSNKKLISKWRSVGMKKITLEVKSKEELLKYKQLADEANIQCALITDAGHTELTPGTQTCLAIGPEAEAKINKITGELKNY